MISTNKNALKAGLFTGFLIGIFLLSFAFVHKSMNSVNPEVLSATTQKKQDYKVTKKQFAFDSTFQTFRNIVIKVIQEDDDLKVVVGDMTTSRMTEILFENKKIGLINKNSILHAKFNDGSDELLFVTQDVGDFGITSKLWKVVTGSSVGIEEFSLTNRGNYNIIDILRLRGYDYIIVASKLTSACSYCASGGVVDVYNSVDGTPLMSYAIEKEEVDLQQFINLKLQTINESIKSLEE